MNAYSISRVQTSFIHSNRQLKSLIYNVKDTDNIFLGSFIIMGKDKGEKETENFLVFQTLGLLV